MDPLSITTTAITLAGLVFKASTAARDAVGQLRDAPETIADIAVESQTVVKMPRKMELGSIGYSHFVDPKSDAPTVTGISGGCYLRLLAAALHKLF
ncbi:hypothetical protein NKR23_g3119 [Pleurostoma richardsiae]|uniref:Uncharacterized protein n=1 Tax=Pleurostoma richardsiae TaxID=41990 RepID=A0AA38VHF6_9PEZI|nr:hypothetical protein NKR23_g3119 [Pleurostoma richardsiae]